MKPLLPSLKEKNRYIVFEVISDKKVTKEDSFKAVLQGCHDFVGKLGVAKAGVMVMNFWKRQRGIIKVDHKNIDKIRASLALINKIDGQKVIVRSLGVSGMINKAEKKFMEAM